MTSFSLLIADANEASLSLLQSYITDHPDFRIVSVCTTEQDIIKQTAITKPDAIIMSIYMREWSGLDIIAACQQFHSNVSVIFMADNRDFAADAFTLSAANYIIKPIQPERLYMALEKVKKMLCTRTVTNKKLPLKFNGTSCYVPFQDILFIEKSGKKCFVYTKEETYETYEKLTDLFACLDQSFYLAHRSNIINLDNVFSIKLKNETYLAYFLDFPKHAHISRLKIKEVQRGIEQLC
ncbi:LytTR family DNA-binding domain-containing protein [Domibacillus sp. A3M-37]|uniref:LytR/AlgR family response regulator transcription factor n=1 Tax=Domibacillus sp. A3M-37 TaxID=2962037 RepID=UPI0020B71682|nr:LytTR family DNA-binding domain-containing protein [Domibacillus sp. A3M-37]MCP3761022.1 LytTR family DNA-binding domain-containing protein [Domibacillus sp. A3M-37]